MSKFLIILTRIIFLVLRLDIFLIGILAITAVGSVHASSSDITLSSPSTVDASGNQKSDIHVGEMVVFSSVISNHSDEAKRFTYLVSVLDQNNQLQARDGISADIGPNQQFTVGSIMDARRTWNIQCADSST